MELTGVTEASARSVFMYVSKSRESAEAARNRRDARPKPGPAEGSNRPGSSPALSLMLAAALLGLGLWPAAAAETVSSTNSFWTQPLSLADAMNLAIQQNPTVLEAQKQVEAAAGVAIQTRAIALPKLGVTGEYNALQASDVDRPANTIPGFTFGTDQNWRGQIRLVQSIYEGGRLLSSFRVARLTREYSMLNYQTTVANTILVVQTSYYNVLLAEQQIVVQEASVELLKSELADTTRRFNAGTVPRFNVLRSEVQLANGQPPLIRARNNFRITKNNLANLLGVNVPTNTVEDLPLRLSGKLEAEPYAVDLSRAINIALERRTELAAMRKAQALRKEDLLYAKAGYKPSLQAFAGYDWHSSLFVEDLTVDVHGWLAGVQLSWDIFDGQRTRGRVQETKALYERAGIEVDDEGRKIELDVRTAFSNFIEAREVVESQKKAVEQAEEAVRLARARYDAGTSTQLDVLSVQTALTQTRTTEIEALRDYSVARARLERAMGLNIPQTASAQ